MRFPLAYLVPTLLLVALASPSSQAAAAAPRPVYQPAGMVANPRVPAQWNRYHDYRQATQLLKQLARAFPERCRLQSLGKSHQGREMWLLTITNFEQGQELEKPAFWIDGGLHANEIQSVEVVLYTAWYLTEMADHNAEIARLLNERVFYLAPMMSPDSRDAHMYEPHSTHSPRSGQIPVDDDRDGLVDEDRADDLDGDAHITQMRIADPNGRYKPHPEYPQLMIAAKTGEQGSYRLLGEEGFDNDGDGRVNEDGDGYYDPNRDWAWNWQPPSVQHGAHRYPFSIPENRLVANFILAHPNLAGAQSYHNAGGMLLRAPGAKNTVVPAADVAVYDQLGKQGEQLLPGYRYMNTAEELYECHGAEFDWFYGMRGVFAFTSELHAPESMFHKPSEGGFFGSKEDRQKFNRYLLFNDGLVEWHEVDHPQYGRVEVGGLKKNWLRQPPSFMLEEECHRNMAFTLFHADAMPHVRVQSIDLRPLGQDLHEVTAVIVNRKPIPTHSAHDLKHQITPPDLVSIAGEKVEVLAALTATSPLFDDPTEQERQPRTVRIKNLSAREPAYIRWIVRGAGPYEVTVRSQKGGVHRLRSDSE